MLFSVMLVQQDEKGNPVSNEVLLNTDEVFFIFRPPMSTETTFSTSVGMVRSVSVVPPGVFELFSKFDTPDGVNIYANAKKVVLTHSPQIGIRVLVFPGGAQAVVKATTAEVTEAIEGVVVNRSKLIV